MVQVNPPHPPPRGWSARVIPPRWRAAWRLIRAVLVSLVPVFIYEVEALLGGQGMSSELTSALCWSGAIALFFLLRRLYWRVRGPECGNCGYRGSPKAVMSDDVDYRRSGFSYPKLIAYYRSGTSICRNCGDIWS
jgi:hypothetical protein